MDNLKEKFLKIAKIGEDENGGISRVFGSSSLKEAQSEMLSFFESCGLDAYKDSVGNVHGILKSEKENAGEILIGSHLDTVKQGGMFDGLLGIVAGAACASALKEEGYPLTKDIHVIATNGEEGNDLGGTFGSRAMMGLLPLESQEFITKAEKMGFLMDNLQNARLDVSHATCYLELHIEQGSTLYNHKEQIGIVTGIVGLRRYKVTINGTSNHAGTTMMEDRNDALVSAARVILMGDELARNMGHHFVETVGMLSVYPGSAPVIPGKVEMILEMRNEDEYRMDAFLQEYEKKAKEIAKVTIEPVVKKAPVKCDNKLISLITDVCKEKEVSYREMPSGATHDGNAMAMGMPIGMIFVPSKNGISHAKDEWTEWEDIEKGVSVLLQTIKNLEKEEKIC